MTGFGLIEDMFLSLPSCLLKLFRAVYVSTTIVKMSLILMMLMMMMIIIIIA